MVEFSKHEITKNGDQAAVIPIHRLQNIRQEIADLQRCENLNHFQQFIVNNIYSLGMPDTDYEIRSILIVAYPSPAAVKVVFGWEGNRIPLTIPASYIDKTRSPRRIETYLQAFLNPQGYHIVYAPRLPHKLIAVRSGLGEYGRNNICYVNGMGSFLNLNPYFSDIPCREDPWQDIRQMDACQTCQICQQHCPTGAILPTRFLIDNERCLTFFNEAGAEWDFPDWIDPSAHHTLYGCLRCQAVCPKNKPYLKLIDAPIEITEEETAILLEGKSDEQLPEQFKAKVNALDMQEYFSAIPRNLRIFLN